MFHNVKELPQSAVSSGSFVPDQYIEKFYHNLQDKDILSMQIKVPAGATVPAGLPAVAASATSRHTLYTREESPLMKVAAEGRVTYAMTNQRARLYKFGQLSLDGFIAEKWRSVFLEKVRSLYPLCATLIRDGRACMPLDMIHMPSNVLHVLKLRVFTRTGAILNCGRHIVAEGNRG